ncbi:MAG: hypothetical protein LBO09_07275 [Candidatus Peribacteria bacterium]|jgi:hypothetical protein|nr:hypothetical protein [Candidatus Peribacteria bacterium]
MKNLIVVLIMGLTMSLLSGCEEKPTVVDGKPICWVEKYGVSYAHVGNQYIFQVSSHTFGKPIAEKIAIAQGLFERDHPDLKYAGERASGEYGQVVTITYYPRVASDSVATQ